MKHCYRLLVCLMVFATACNQEPNDPNSTNNQPPAETDISTMSDEKITLSCVDITQPSDQMPHHEVYISIGSGNKVKVGDILVCNPIPRTEFPAFNIPPNAICAVGGEVDQDGMVIYAIRQRLDYLVVRQGTRADSDTGAYYQYRALANFNPEQLSSNPNIQQAELVGTYAYRGLDHGTVILIGQGQAGLNAFIFEIEGELPTDHAKIPEAISTVAPTQIGDFQLDMQALRFNSTIGVGQFKRENSQLFLELVDRVDPNGKPVQLQKVQ